MRAKRWDLFNLIFDCVWMSRAAVQESNIGLCFKSGKDIFFVSNSFTLKLGIVVWRVKSESVNY